MPAYLHLRMSYYAVGIREEVPNGAQRRGPSSLANVHIGCCGRDPEASGLQPHVMRRGKITTDTCTHGASDS
jgi:hypothetical protein